MLTLGIPGDSTTAVLLGSLMMYGLTPGWQMFNEAADFTAQIMILMVLANLAFLIIGLATAKSVARFLNMKSQTVWAAVSVLCVVGSYAINNRFLDVVIMLVMAIIGFFLKVYQFPNGPLVLGLLLGSTMEKNMRRALVVSSGEWSYFVTQPISCVLLILVIATFCVPIVKGIIGKRKKAAANDSMDAPQE